MRDPMTALTVPVALGERSYDILIGEDLLDQAGALIAQATRLRRAIIVTDESVGPLYLPRLKASLAAAGIDTAELMVPPGE
jgi:3-dehydroquinate synthetase